MSGKEGFWASVGALSMAAAGVMGAFIKGYFSRGDKNTDELSKWRAELTARLDKEILKREELEATLFQTKKAHNEELDVLRKRHNEEQDSLRTKYLAIFDQNHELQLQVRGLAEDKAELLDREKVLLKRVEELSASFKKAEEKVERAQTRMDQLEQHYSKALEELQKLREITPGA